MSPDRDREQTRTILCRLYFRQRTMVTGRLYSSVVDGVRTLTVVWTRMDSTALCQQSLLSPVTILRITAGLGILVSIILPSGVLRVALQG